MDDRRVAFACSLIAVAGTEQVALDDWHKDATAETLADALEVPRDEVFARGMADAALILTYLAGRGDMGR